MILFRILYRLSEYLLPVLLLGLFSCAQSPVIVVQPPLETQEEIIKAKEIWNKIEERNKTVEATPEWISNSYTGIKIKSLANIPLGKYLDYKKYLEDGNRVYIINHPAYFAFFHHPKVKRKDDSLNKNIMDTILDADPSSYEISRNNGSSHNYSRTFINYAREFERIGRNFIEFKSVEQKLIILLFPGNYKNYSNYHYKNGPDEYARYINEVTNLSESVIYLESKKPNRGQISDEDLATLTDFLYKIGATSVLIGGEYVGRCEEDFYKQLKGAVGSVINIEIIPELSTVSPDDMNSSMDDLLDSNNKLNLEAVITNMALNKYKKLEIIPKMRSIKYRLFY